MSSPQNPATMENLSDDVFSYIFIRLPAKRLAQARCVSKSWNALLSRSSVVTSHLHRSIRHNDEILFAFSDLLPFDPKPFTAHPSQSPHQEVELTNLIKLPINFHLRHASGTLIGSANGLICFRHEDSHALCIWNPSLSAVLSLPPYYMPSSAYKTFTALFRFGFDRKNDDYKVVKLVRFIYGNDKYFCREWLQVEVYSMRKGSWESITQRFPSEVEHIYGEDNVCVDGHDGHLHWLGYTDEIIESIVAFDLGAETFRVIPLPDSIQDGHSGHISNTLGILGGKVCVMSCVMDEECEVWMMNEYGVVESWVKNHVFSGFSGNIIPFGFTLRNEFLFQVSQHGFGLYDPVEAKTKIFKVRGRPYTTRKVVHYVDSLVWPRVR
ncbi:unnamed protein product [Lactuca saligna]|uniref:F-box domain-containing protein n=1 Tax=Lactuca saligna TaxID=75948 RepID=A0AA35YH55_LACSI|nr:unnamed protein product [Lactuca saligna]